MSQCHVTIRQVSGSIPCGNQTDLRPRAYSRPAMRYRLHFHVNTVQLKTYAIKKSRSLSLTPSLKQIQPSGSHKSLRLHEQPFAVRTNDGYVKKATDTDWRVCSWPSHLLALGKDHSLLFVNSNRCITVKNASGWKCSCVLCVW